MGTGTQKRLRHAVLGGPHDVQDPRTYHAISLVALLAWVGLGADGLSSSAYGPDEAFRALGPHAYLAVALAGATAVTVLVISIAYSQIIRRFPFGGGGYVVASELLGPRWGVVSGAALLVGGYGGLGIHALLSVQRLFPNHFRNFVFVSVGVIDAAAMKGVEEVDRVRERTEQSLAHYVELAASWASPPTRA